MKARVEKYYFNAHSSSGVNWVVNNHVEIVRHAYLVGTCASE
jgi:hypothetical protein